MFNVRLHAKLYTALLLQDIEQALTAKEPEVTSCREMGSNLKKYLIDDEKPKVDQALSEVDEKWNSLQAEVDKLTKKLFSSQERVESFQLEVDELKTWLTETEGTLSNVEPVGVEPERVKEQLGDQAVSSHAFRTRLHCSRCVLDCRVVNFANAAYLVSKTR